MRISLLAGLPGSGKTTLLEEWSAGGAVTVDDIISMESLPPAPVAWLAIADVNFCRAEVRAGAQAALAARYPGATLEWTFFANDREACLANVRRRDDGRDVVPDIMALSRAYAVPPDAEEIPVYRPDAPSPP